MALSSLVLPSFATHRIAKYKIHCLEICELSPLTQVAQLEIKNQINEIKECYGMKGKFLNAVNNVCVIMQERSERMNG